jgi:mRNA interferase HigB
MHIISIKKLRDFWTQHPDAETALRTWYADTSRSIWRTPADIKERYPTASLVGTDHIVFNIKGNRYRLVVVVIFRNEIIYIRFIGTHPEYDRIDAAKV